MKAASFFYRVILCKYNVITYLCSAIKKVKQCKYIVKLHYFLLLLQIYAFYFV